MKRICTVNLWTLNRGLLWLGFRIFVEQPATAIGWTKVGLVWYGLAFLREGGAP